MNLLVLCKLQFFFHARDISAVKSVLIKPFDVEAKTAHSQQDAIELPEQLLLLLGVVTWVPIEDIQPSEFQRSGWFLSRRAHEGKLRFLLKLGLKVRRCCSDVHLDVGPGRHFVAVVDLGKTNILEQNV